MTRPAAFAAAALSIVSCASVRPGMEDPEGRSLIRMGPRADLDSYRSWIGPAPAEPPPAAFTVHEKNGRWWIVAPSGRLFWASALRRAGCGLDRGEPVTPYRDVLQRKWGSEAFPARCRDRALERLIAWGFAAIGTESSESLFRENRLPFLTEGLAPDSLRVPLAAPGLPDGFIGDLVVKLAPGSMHLNRWQTSPFCLGHPAKVRGGWEELAAGVLSMPADAPAKKDWFLELRTRYKTVAALNAAWGLSATSFETMRWPGNDRATEVARHDLASYRGRFADWLYSAVAEAIRYGDNSHMVFGWKVVPGVTPPEVAAAIARKSDVVVVEIADAEAGLPAVEKLAAELKRPLYVIASAAAAVGPADLPAAWARAMEHLAAIPAVVGAEISSYLPNADGTAFVDWHDEPAALLAAAARKANDRLLRIHAGELTPVP